MLRASARLLALALLVSAAVVGLASPASAATGTIQGTVTGLTTGVPIGAWVHVYSAEPETDVFTDPCADDNCVGSAQTDGSGSFAVSGLAVGSYKVYVQSNNVGYYSRWYGGKGDTYAGATSVAAPNGGHTDIAVQLTVKGGIGGTVSDDTGVKSGVTVTAYQVNGDGSQNATGKNTTTDAGGHYLISSLTPGNYRVYASDPAHVGLWNGGATSFGTAANVTVAGGGNTTGVNFTLARYGSISGTVTDAGSAAVVGATVEAHSVVAGTDGGVARTTISAVDGTYTLGTLVPGTYRVRAVPAGVASGPAWNGNAVSFASAANITVTSGGSVTGTSIALPAAPGGISGSVTPVLPGTTVTALPYSGNGDGVTTAIDKSGSFQLAVPAGAYLLRVDPPASRPDYPTAWVYQRCSFGACTWVTLARPASVFDGYDPLRVDAGAVTSGVSAVLPRVPVIAGQITDTHGDPVANATVELWLRGRVDPFSNLDSMTWSLIGDDLCAGGDYYGAPAPCATVTTDAKGNYLLRPPPRSTWSDFYFADKWDWVLLVRPATGDLHHRPHWVGADSDADLPTSWPPPWGDVRETYGHHGYTDWITVQGYGVDPELLSLDQVLSGSAAFTGTLTSSLGGPAVGVSVRVHSNLDDGSAMAGRNYTTTTAGDGTWSVGGLPPGGYSIFFGDSSDHYVPRAFDGGAGRIVTEYQTITGVDGTLQAGGRVIGTVTGDDGTGAAPLAGATVHVYLPAGGEVGSAVTGADGTYALGVEAAVYRLYVTPPAGADYEAGWYGSGATSQQTAADVPVVLGADAVANAQLAFVGDDTPPRVATTLTVKPAASQTRAGTKVTVAGVLSDAQGHLVADAQLTLQTRAGTSDGFKTVAITTTSATGTATVAVAPTVTTTYRWVYTGDGTHLARTSPSAVVKVSFAVLAKAVKATLSHKAKATIWGTVTPARAGTEVVLQQLAHGNWTLAATSTVRKQRLPDAKTPRLGYVFKLSKAKGAYTFRVIARATAETNLQGISGRVRLRLT